MHISALLVCDAASVREGLLHVLGAGITYLSRESFPAPLMADIALLINHRASDTSVSLSLALRRDGESDVLAEVEVEGKLEPRKDLSPNGYSCTPLTLDAAGIALPGPGNYTLTLTLTDGEGLTTNFTAVEAPTP